MSINPLIGTWRLLSFELRGEDGTIVHPWGTEVAGQVIYTADGYMSGCLMPAGRPAFASDDVMGGNTAEFEAAMKSYIGYAGPYSIDKDKLTHHAAVSLFPNWTGTEIIRYWAVEDNRLSLSTPPGTFGGWKATGVLVWELLPPRDVMI
jgi:hypothetical protein